MKRLALVAALAVPALMTACTTIHEDRRTLTGWNLELIGDAASPGPSPSGETWHADGIVNPILSWIFVEPIACVMLPISWLGDTLILNPIDGWKKAELQVHARKFGEDPSRGAAEGANQAYTPLPPWGGPWPISALLTIPEFTAHWVWNSTYPTRPSSKEAYNRYWNEHNEQTAQ